MTGGQACEVQRTFQNGEVFQEELELKETAWKVQVNCGTGKQGKQKTRDKSMELGADYQLEVVDEVAVKESLCGA